MTKSCRVIKVGQTGSYERTNPDYVDNHVAQLARDYKACPEDWRQCFLAGLSKRDFEQLRERLQHEK